MAITPSFNREYADQLRNFTAETENERRIWDSLEQLAQSVSYNRPIATFFEDCQPGELVNIYESGGILTARKANAAAPLYAYAFVSTTAEVLAGGTGEVTVIGLNLFLTGLTPGATYYLSDTPGEVSITPGANAQIVGIAYSDSILFQNFGTALSGIPNAVQIEVQSNGAQISPTLSVLNFISLRATAVGSTITVAPEWNRLALTSDVINADVTPDTLADTGLEFPADTGVLYEFRVHGFYDSVATTTGCRFTLAGPGLNSLALRTIYTGVVAEAISGYGLPGAASASNALTGNTVEMYGFINVSAANDVRVQFASEISGSAITLKAGSYIEWRTI